MKYGYVTVASSIPSVKVGDVAFNILNIELPLPKPMAKAWK